jgi:hypothetical protein
MNKQWDWREIIYKPERGSIIAVIKANQLFEHLKLMFVVVLIRRNKRCWCFAFENRVT